MIEIITTRFREAYTWIIPAEHERLQSGGFKRERTIHSVKRFSNELHKSFSLEQDVKETRVIIADFIVSLLSPDRTSWMNKSSCRWPKRLKGKLNVMHHRFCHHTAYFVKIAQKT